MSIVTDHFNYLNDAPTTENKHKGVTSTTTENIATSWSTPISTQQPTVKQQPISNRYYELSPNDCIKTCENEYIIDTLNALFDLISLATDRELSAIERSNAFDEWNDYLITLAKLSNSLTIKHNKIIGGLISVCAEKDISSFSTSQLELFLKYSNVVREPQITRNDVNRFLSEVVSASRIEIRISPEEDLNAESESIKFLSKFIGKNNIGQPNE